MQLHRLGEVASTNDELAILARAGARSGTAVAAEHQTAGRGRKGRTWLSPTGEHVFVSILWRPPQSIPMSALAGLTLDIGVAIVEVLAAFGVNARVKWPNDVWVGDKKIAGVLSELQDDGVIIGIGINVNASTAELPADIHALATTMEVVAGHRFERDAVLEALVTSVRTACSAYGARGGHPNNSRYTDLCITIGRHVSVEGRTGVATGIAPDGALLVRFDDSQSERVVAGDVDLLAPTTSAP